MDTTTQTAAERTANNLRILSRERLSDDTVREMADAESGPEYTAHVEDRRAQPVGEETGHGFQPVPLR